MRDLKEIRRLMQVYPPSWRRWCSAGGDPGGGGCACLGCVLQPAPSTVHGDPEGQAFPNPSDKLTREEVDLWERDPEKNSDMS
jgi:hypothetical protein